MRKAIGVLCAAWLLAGCAHPKPSGAPAAKLPTPFITPDLRPVGRVALVDSEARFVVITFPAGTVPQVGQPLNVNHQGLKIGEVKVTGPQRDNDTVADLIAGQAYVGDEVKGE
ncbi:MAG TPA: hypothetical protein VMR33_20770 [Candidatus Baltobacteraceae bacterium]|jgi:hypothetical protein|nr:hypothetical protein [Candidatus Baltobacteraceae bacterium]